MHNKGPYILGLTGAIGSGKSSLARLFRRVGVRVSCSDSHVDHLYNHSGEFHGFLRRHFPRCFDKGGRLDKVRLRAHIFNHPPARQLLEDFLHPQVRLCHERAIDDGTKSGESLIVLDVPLLFESGMETLCHGVLVAVCQNAIRQDRVLARPHMTPDLLTLIEAAQMDPDEKKHRSTFCIDTSVSHRQTWKTLRSYLTTPCESHGDE